MDDFDWMNIRASVLNEIGRGNQAWARIVEDALVLVKEQADESSKNYPSIYQIKEKFGELRIYYDHSKADNRQQDIIAGAISEANTSCQKCGNNCRPQLLNGWVVNFCCWCAHRVAEDSGNEIPRLNANTMDERLRCTSCGYIGQIAWKASGHKCPACVAKRL